jgi:hypothetical protein
MAQNIPYQMNTALIPPTYTPFQASPDYGIKPSYAPYNFNLSSATPSSTLTPTTIIINKGSRSKWIFIGSIICIILCCLCIYLIGRSISNALTSSTTTVIVSEPNTVTSTQTNTDNVRLVTSEQNNLSTANNTQNSTNNSTNATNNQSNNTTTPPTSVRSPSPTTTPPSPTPTPPTTVTPLSPTTMNDLLNAPSPSPPSSSSPSSSVPPVVDLNNFDTALNVSGVPTI